MTASSTTSSSSHERRSASQLPGSPRWCAMPTRRRAASPCPCPTARSRSRFGCPPSMRATTGRWHCKRTLPTHTASSHSSSTMLQTWAVRMRRRTTCRQLCGQLCSPPSLPLPLLAPALLPTPPMPSSPTHLLLRRPGTRQLRGLRRPRPRPCRLLRHRGRRRRCLASWTCSASWTGGALGARSAALRARSAPRSTRPTAIMPITPPTPLSRTQWTAFRPIAARAARRQHAPRRQAGSSKWAPRRRAEVAAFRPAARGPRSPTSPRLLSWPNSSAVAASCHPSQGGLGSSSAAANTRWPRCRRSCTHRARARPWRGSSVSRRPPPSVARRLPPLAASPARPPSYRAAPPPARAEGGRARRSRRRRRWSAGGRLPRTASAAGPSERRRRARWQRRARWRRQPWVATPLSPAPMMAPGPPLLRVVAPLAP